MPNLYVTPQEIKDAMPDGIRSTTTDYDQIIYQLAERVCRWIDKKTDREFYPYYDTRYFDGDGGIELWIPDLITIDSISYSRDNGLNYTLFTTDDYYPTVAGDFNARASYTLLTANVNTKAAISYWPAGQRSIKIVGDWGRCEDRNEVWEASGDTVQDDPLSDSATSITVSDADAVNLWADTPRFNVGQIIQIEDEWIEITAINTTTNVLTVVRGRNGTTAAAHVQTTAIDIWRPPGPVKQAAIIQAVRQMERGFQGYGDARATPEIGQLFYIKSIDPEALAYLLPFVDMRG